MKSGGWGALSLLLLSACNAQFDFDATAALDAGDVVPELDATSEVGEQDGGFVIDASPPDISISDAPPPSIHINCGQAVCTEPSCCSTDAGQTCVATGDGTCSGLSIQCDDTADCPADKVCCAETGNNLNLRSGTNGAPNDSERLVRVHCETEAHCRSLNYVILCDPDNPAPCAQCVLSSLALLPPGYHQCNDTP